MNQRIAGIGLVALVVAGTPASVSAEASGPDYWNVSGVRADDVLYVHKDASARSPRIGHFAPDAKGLKNLGCTGVPTFQQYMAMSEQDRARASRSRWCKVQLGSLTGWVGGRFLVEGTAVAEAKQAAPRHIGSWSLSCSADCELRQTALGTTRPTTMRIVRREGNNAEITIERKGLPVKGTLSIYMDGDLITEGPIASMSKGPGKIVMQPTTSRSDSSSK